MVGRGPASAAICQALEHRGADVTVIGPDGRPPRHTLCAFADQVPQNLVGAMFPATVVASNAGLVDLERPYVRLDPDACVRLPARTTVVEAKVDALQPSGVSTSAGPVGADVVVDASGHAPVLVSRAATPPAFQSAFGVVVDGRDDELPHGTALFMDWRDHGVDDGGPPSFLYALSNRGRLLLEETTLASWRPVPASLLKRRLERRLQRRGTVIDVILDDEVVEFPMGGGLPLRGQRVAAFGAALGLVSPVSGYSVARSLALADRVADVLTRPRSDEAVIGDVVLDAVWDREARERRRLERFALRAACAFTQRDADSFFSTFFALPASRWRGFLDGNAAVDEVRRTMWSLFGSVSSTLRLRLVAGAATLDGLAVASDLITSPVTARFATRSVS